MEWAALFCTLRGRSAKFPDTLGKEDGHRSLSILTCFQGVKRPSAKPRSARFFCVSRESRSASSQAATNSSMLRWVCKDPPGPFPGRPDSRRPAPIECDRCLHRVRSAGAPCCQLPRVFTRPVPGPSWFASPAHPETPVGCAIRVPHARAGRDKSACRAAAPFPGARACRCV
jgi:hypothetical protein